MAEFIIHRGSHQIGGMCAEVRTSTSRVIIDFGANLPDTDEDEAKISDEQLFDKVFGNNPKADAVLFTHYHGDHIGLMDKIPKDIPQYMGSVAVEIARNVTSRTDKVTNKNNTAIIDKMNTYTAGKALTFNDIKVTPYLIGHSALDSYMFLIEVDKKRILYTGDFRDHGIVCSGDIFSNLVDNHIGKVDILVTEGTTLDGNHEELVTEDYLYNKAKELFQKKKYNFVLVSSTNLDSIMSFYHAVPDDKEFICDAYQYIQMGVAHRNFGTYYGGKYNRYNKAVRTIILCNNICERDRKSVV